MKRDIKLEWFKSVVDRLSEGMIITDSSRVIHYINELAFAMTGWNVGDTVPFCSYCKIRQIIPGDERCILVKEKSSLMFQTNMPTASGVYQEFNLSTNFLHVNGDRYTVLILHNPLWQLEQHAKQMKQLLIQETMMAQEGERKRISMELHDHIGQGVYSAFLGLQGLKNFIHDEKSKKFLLNMERSLEQTLEDIKRLSKELHPAILDDLGIHRTLQSAIEEWSTSYGVEISMLGPDDMESIDICPETSLHLFRVIQEAVNNAVRHGKAEHITIAFCLKNSQLLFSVSDDGIGFQPKEKAYAGLGLSHMMERMEIVGGLVNIRSQPGGPTIVDGYIPISGVKRYECVNRG